MKRISFFIVLAFMIFSNTSFAQDSNMIMGTSVSMPQGSTQTPSFQDVPSNAVYFDSVNRLSEFGVIRGDNRGMFHPDGDVTREQFVTMLVNSLGYESRALNWDGESYFNDVDNSRWSSGFINLGFEKSFFSGTGGGYFAPLQDVTFAQAVTMLVRSRDIELQEGEWPQNYLDKAKQLNITAGVSLRANEKAPRWAIAVMLDNILLNDVTSTVKMGADLTEASKDYIILADSNTNPDFPSEQILTNRGVLTLPSELGTVEVGEKHRIASYGDRVLALFGRVRDIKSVAVKDFNQNELTYITQFRGEEKTLELKRGAKYYYDGQRIEFEMLGNVVRSKSSIVFGTNESGYDYAVIVDPIYREPLVIRDEEISKDRIGSIKIDDKTVVLRNGKSISPLDIRQRDVVYRVRNLNNFMQYIEVIDEKIEGEITEILPNKISPRNVRIGNTKVEIGRFLNRNKINTSEGSFNVGDNVSVLLGYDGKIVDIERLTTRTDPSVDVIIQANNLTDNSLGEKQVNTNMGVLNVGEIDEDLRVGVEYEVLIDENNIIRVEERITDVLYYTIESAFDNVIRVWEQGQKSREFHIEQKILPSGIDYFYNGIPLDISSVSSVMKRNSTIAFAKNERGSGFQYAVIIDPVKSSPVVLSSTDIRSSNIAGIDMNNKRVDIINGGKRLEVSDLREFDVAYLIEDVKNQFKYIQIVRNRFDGEIINITPSKASPQNIQIEGEAVELGRFFDIDKLNTNRDSFNVGDFASVILGIDGKVVDILELTRRKGQKMDIIVQANSDIDNSLGIDQVQTDKGILNVATFNKELKLGGMYKVEVDDSYIIDIKESRRDIEYVTIENSVGDVVRIRYEGRDGRDAISKFDLPNTTYYHNGIILQSLIQVRDALKTNSTLALAKRVGGVGYDYAVVIDPVYSKPGVVSGSVSRGTKVGDIIFSNYTKILRNGDFANLIDISHRDVVYEVKDYLNTTKYIDIYPKSYSGRLAAVLPNRLSPRTIVVNEQIFTLSGYVNIEKLNDPNDSFDIGDSVILLLGRNDEVIEIR